MAKEHLHELPETTTTTRDEAIVKALGDLDNLAFDSPEDRAGWFCRLLADQGFWVYRSIPMPPERAIR